MLSRQLLRPVLEGRRSPARAVLTLCREPRNLDEMDATPPSQLFPLFLSTVTFPTPWNCRTFRFQVSSLSLRASHGARRN